MLRNSSPGLDLAGVAVVLLAFFPVIPRAQTPAELALQRYEVDGQHSTVGFVAKILGAVKVRGRFTNYDATIIYDAEHPDRSSVSAVIQTASLDTDMKFRDDHLRSPDFFDTEHFPTIEFRSDRVTRRADDLLVSGALTMRGVTQRIDLPMQLILGPDSSATGVARIAFEGQLRLSRKAFGIAGTNRFNPSYNPATNMLSDSVEIDLEIFALRPAYAHRRLDLLNPPSVADTVSKMLDAKGVPAAIALYRSLKATAPNEYNFSPGQLDLLGHVLIARHRLPEALPFFRLNVELFETTPGVLESLGQAMALANDREAALAAYHHALEVTPASSEAREMVRHLEGT